MDWKQTIIVAGAETIDITTFRYAGPYIVQAPFQVDSVDAVSYTHLDVYKRQAIGSLKGMPISIMLIPFFSRTVMVLAVPSKDVYKRQRFTVLSKRTWCLTKTRFLGPGLVFMPLGGFIWRCNRNGSYHRTVSYTHLDVYKRQRIYSGMSSALWWVMNGRAAAPPAMDCRIGVSTSI